MKSEIKKNKEAPINIDLSLSTLSISVQLAELSKYIILMKRK